MLSNRSAFVLPLNIPLTGDKRLIYATAEVLSLRADPVLRLGWKASRGAQAEFLLETKRPKRITLDGKPVEGRFVNGQLFLHLPASGDIQELTIA